MTTKLAPRAIRADVVEAAGAYTLAEIRRRFESEGFSLPPNLEPTQGSRRMSMAQAFDESIEFGASGAGRAETTRRGLSARAAPAHR